MTVTIHQGDVLAVLPTLAEGSVDCCVTSPPYWGLRDYGADGQIGLEATVDEYVGRMVEVFREVRRVLSPSGTLWLNLGDKYAGARSGAPGASGITSGRNHRAASGARGRHGGKGHGCKAKDLIGLPWRVAFALQADGWYLRSDIIWHKTNPMPEAVKDRPTRCHEYLFLLSPSPRYTYDADAIKVPASPNTHSRGSGVNPKAKANAAGARQNASFSAAVSGVVTERNRRTVWTIPQEPLSEAHFATYPTKLVEPCILAGCPAGGTVLDPFGGAGTTGLVADRLGRHAVLVEINPEYIEIARSRIRRDSPLFSQITETANG